MRDIVELEKEANQQILNDMQHILDKYVLKYRNTSAFMTLNRCVDELVNVEQTKMLQEII